MTQGVEAWQCIGCGRIDAPQTCVGICEYRRVRFVHASDHEAALTAASAARREADIFGMLARRLVHTSPRPGEWERCYKAMQEHAHRALREVDRSTGRSTATQSPAGSVRQCDAVPRTPRQPPSGPRE